MGSRKPRKARSSRRNNKTVPAIFLSLIVFAAIGVFIYAFVYLVDRNPIDELTLCPKNGSVGSLTILVDASDPITVVQKKLVVSWLQKEIGSAEEGTLVRLFTIAESDGNIQICKPKNPNDVSMLTDNPVIRSEVFNEKFVGPLKNTLSSMLSSSGSNKSPIMEAILPATLSEEIANTNSSGNKLIIVSDLLQNSDNFSFFQGHSWGTFENSSAFGRLGRNLEHYSVVLYSIPRTQYASINHESVKEFWWNYFDHQGVSKVEIQVVGDL